MWSPVAPTPWPRTTRDGGDDIQAICTLAYRSALWRDGGDDDTPGDGATAAPARDGGAADGAQVGRCVYEDTSFDEDRAFVRALKQQRRRPGGAMATADDDDGAAAAVRVARGARRARDGYVPAWSGGPNLTRRAASLRGPSLTRRAASLRCASRGYRRARRSSST